MWGVLATSVLLSSLVTALIITIVACVVMKKKLAQKQQSTPIVSARYCLPPLHDRAATAKEKEWQELTDKLSKNSSAL